MANERLVESIKEFHRSFPTGVTIVTASAEGKPHGLAVNAFASVSLEPPMVMVCIKATSSTYQRLFAVDQIGVSILANNQIDVAQIFSRPGLDKFGEISWSRGASGAPLIDGASAQLEFTVRSRMLAGTHTIFVGEVTSASSSRRPPLIYFASKFFDGEKLVPIELSAEQ